MDLIEAISVKVAMVVVRLVPKQGNLKETVCMHGFYKVFQVTLCEGLMGS